MSAIGSARSRWSAPLAWAALLALGTSWPNPRVPSAPHGDTVVHFGLYAVLAFLVARALATASPALRTGATIAAVLVFAAADEWHQRFIPGRSASRRDFAADAAGAVVGVAAALAFTGRAGVRDARA